MRGKLPAVLSLILLAAASPLPGGCPPQPARPTLPPITPPLPGAGARAAEPSSTLSGSVFTAPARDPLEGGCRVPADGEGTLRDEQADILHGLAAPDMLRSPLDGVRR